MFAIFVFVFANINNVFKFICIALWSIAFWLLNGFIDDLMWHSFYTTVCFIMVEKGISLEVSYSKYRDLVYNNTWKTSQQDFCALRVNGLDAVLLLTVLKLYIN